MWIQVQPQVQPSDAKVVDQKALPNSAKTSLDTKKLQATSDIAKKMQAVKH
jgi:hypothetical protein